MISSHVLDEVLDENQITGVPVVDDDDTGVGVVSITDLLTPGMDDSNNLAVVGSDGHKQHSPNHHHR